MKYFIYFVVAVVFFTIGAVFVGYSASVKFESMTGVTLSQFVDGYNACEKTAHEHCNMYGGFAPLSLFKK